MQRSASLQIEAELSTTALRLLAHSNRDEKVDGNIGHVGGVLWGWDRSYRECKSHDDSYTGTRQLISL